MSTNGRPMSASPQQRAVMDHPLGAPALVDAGAGTGKTFTIVERVAALHADPGKGCPASSILLLTFSKKAAAELRGRIVKRLGPGVEPPECATFHAFAFSLLKEHGFELELSPDSALINDVDARVEFWKVFDELIRGDLGVDAAVFPLRFWVVDAVRKSLFNVCQGLRDRGVSIDEFRDAALRAADAFAKMKARVLVDPSSRRPKEPLAEISDADFEREVVEERRRIDAAAALFRRYDESLRERVALTYADLLNVAIEMIERRPEIARALRGRFRHCIVDEYQDTDARQVRLLEAMFGAGCERVVVVGDPRQTIYGFRGIDPHNVRSFSGKTSCVRYALTENRRSRQEILDLAHSVIGPHFEDEAPLRATRGNADKPVVHARSRWRQAGEEHPNAAQTRELEARWVARTIVGLLESGRLVESAERPGESEPLAPRHIAILSRRKTKLQPLIDALNACDLPFRQYGGAGFYEAPEVRDALAWLRLLIDPLDDKAVARVLSSPAVGLSDASIVALCRGMRDEASHIASRAALDDVPADLEPEARERLERFRRTLDALEEFAGAPLVVAWEALLDRAGLLLAVGIRSGHRHDQARANVDKLSAMVRAFAERNPGARASDFDRYVFELSEAEADDQEADPPSADAINVMTIHAAKGLEWPVVFVIDVWPPLASEYAPVRIDAATGALLVTEGADGERPFHTIFVEKGADADGNVAHGKQRDVEGDLEERRLFYVALTRARDELFVSGGRTKPGVKNPQGTAKPFLQHVIDWIERRGWSTLDERATEATYVRSDTPPGTITTLADFVLERPVGFDVKLPALSFSSISQFEMCPRSVTYRLALGLPGLGRAPFDDDAAEDDPGSADPAPDSPLSAGTYGDLVHRALELWGREPGGAATAYVATAMRDLGLTPAAAERERAIAAVGAVFGRLAGWRPLRVEAPFALDVGDVEVTGFIDLIAADPDGKTIIIDYKTGTTAKEHYALQLGLYRIAAMQAYGVDVAGCAIARLGATGVTLETVELPDEAAVRARVAAVADGIRRADLTAKAGPQCVTCPYRAAPCLDFAPAEPVQLTLAT